MNQEDQNMGHDSDAFFDEVEGDLPVAVEAAGDNAEVAEGDAPVPAGNFLRVQAHLRTFKSSLEGIHAGFFCYR